MTSTTSTTSTISTTSIISTISATPTIIFAAEPPPGTISNINSPYRADALFATVAIFLPLATVFLAIRIFTRSRIVGNLALDDFFMIIAWAFSVPLAGLSLDQINYGLGKHIWDVPLTDIYPHSQMRNYIASIMQIASTGFSKCSVLLFYQRIFPSRTFQMVVWGLIFFTGAYSFACLLVEIFSCNPIAKTWDLKYADTGSCIALPAFYLSHAGLGILADFATVIAPIPMLRRLRLPMRQKVGVFIVITIGGSVCIISIGRLQSLAALIQSTDPTHSILPALCLSMVEVDMSIALGCVPTLKPFFQKYFPRILGPSTGDYIYDSRGRTQSYRMGIFKMMKLNKAPVSFVNVTTRTPEPPGGGHDNNSQEDIIRRRGSVPSVVDEEAGIVKTVEFGYDYVDHTTKPSGSTAQNEIGHS